MFDIGFSELLLVLIIGLVVLGPQRLPVVVKTVASWLRALRSLVSNVQHELARELKVQELQDSLKKMEQEIDLQQISPELKASLDEVKQIAETMQQPDVAPMDEAATAEQPEQTASQSKAASARKSASAPSPTASIDDNRDE